MKISCSSYCDSEQVDVDDWNNDDDILSEMVYARTTFHCDVIVSSYHVDCSIETSDVINFDAQADSNIEDENKTYFSKSK